jgi:alpha-beta hydrolase superfamily lysophospholipase
MASPAGAPPPAAQPADGPPRLCRVRRVEDRVISRHGHALVAHRWDADPDAPPNEHPPPHVATLLLAHGYANYIGSYFDWKAAVLASYGLRVRALDQFGHGKSDGVPALVPSLSVLVDDLEDLARAIKAEDEAVEEAAAAAAAGHPRQPRRPLFCYGESMGGAVAIQAARRDPSLFAGLVLLAPMAGFDAAELPHPLVQAVGRVAAWLAPWAPLTPLKRDMQAFLFRDPARAAEVAADPHKYAGRLRLGTAMAFKDATAEIQAGLGDVATPLLTLHGTADVITSPAVSRALHDAAPAGGDKTLTLYQDAWHALWWESAPSRRDMLACIVSWLHARSPAAVAAGLAAAPVLPVNAVVTRPDMPGPFRVPGDAMTPWTYATHGRAGGPVVAGTGWGDDGPPPGAPMRPEAALRPPSEAVAPGGERVVVPPGPETGAIEEE